MHFRKRRVKGLRKCHANNSDKNKIWVDLRVVTKSVLSIFRKCFKYIIIIIIIVFVVTGIYYLRLNTLRCFNKLLSPSAIDVSFLYELSNLSHFTCCLRVLLRLDLFACLSWFWIINPSMSGDTKGHAFLNKPAVFS